MASSSQRGRAVLVTGSRRGIGRAIALAFTEAGADLALCDTVADDGELEATAEKVRAQGGRVLTWQTDVTERAQVERLVEKVLGELGRIDVLVNNAGVAGGSSLLAFDEAEFSRVYDVTVKGTILCSSIAGKAMIEQGGGNIINLSSMGAYLNKGANAYSLAKTAIISITKGLALELGRHGVRVNAIAPGVIRTDMTQPMLQHPEIERYFAERTPLGRIGEPTDIANVALFLASDAAAFITGQTILVDGGISPLDLPTLPTAAGPQPSEEESHE